MSGKNKVHETGAVRSKDVDHLSLDLLPSLPLKEIAKVMKEGSLKYSAHNWRKGLRYRDTYNHLMNHLLNWLEGGSTEELSHAGCNLLFLLEFELRPDKYKELDDRYWPANAATPPRQPIQYVEQLLDIDDIGNPIRT